MKDIYKILKDHGLELEEEAKEKFEKEFFENYKTVAEFEKKAKSLDDLKTKYDADIKKRDDDLKNLENDLKNSEKNDGKVEELSKKLEDLQKEYDDTKKQHEEDIKKQNYSFAVREALAGIKFSSNSAKELFEQKLIDQNLSLQDGKIMGFDDFVASYKETDAGAFVDEKGGDPKPKFSSKIGNGEPKNEENGGGTRQNPIMI